MNLYEPFEKKGIWWVPENTSVKIEGILKFDPENGVRLALDSSFCAHEERKKIKTIFGKVDYDKPVTLRKCVMIKYSISSSNNFYAETEIFANGMLYGYHIKEREAVFDEVRFKISSLEEWLSINVFNVKSEHSQKKFLLEYNHPKEYEYKINSDIKIRSGYRILRKFPSRSSCEIKHEDFVVIEIGKPQTIDWFIDQIDSFIKLLTVLSDKRMIPEEILFNIKNENQLSYHYFFRPRLSDKRDSKKWLDLLFNHADLEQNFDKILKKWYELKDKIGNVLDLFHYSFYTKVPFSHFTFLSISQVCERLGATFLNNKVRPGHKECLQALHDYLPSKIQNDLIDNRDSFLNLEKNTRNYYSHYTDQDKIFQENELYWVTQKMRWMFAIALYKKLGISEDDILKRLYDNNNFYHATRAKIKQEHG